MTGVKETDVISYQAQSNAQDTTALSVSSQYPLSAVLAKRTLPRILLGTLYILHVLIVLRSLQCIQWIGSVVSGVVNRIGS